MYQPQLIEVDPQRIKFSAQNPRKHRGTDFVRLKQSVKEVGIVQLPTVRVIPGGFYEVIDGEGRVRSAQDARLHNMWAVSLGKVTDQDALLMLQASNTVRSFGFLAECRGLANLHRQGQHAESITKALGYDSARAVQNLIAIGYFPDHLIEVMQNDIMRGEGERERGISWSTALQFILPLRQLLPGKVFPGQLRPGKKGDTPGWESLDGLYDYTEVQRAIEQIIGGAIRTEDQLRAYIEQRRRELFEDQFNKELREQLDIALAQTKGMLEESYNQQLQGVQQKTAERYEAQVNALRRQYEELDQQYQKLVKDVARRPEIIAEREKQLQQKLKDAEAERTRFQSLQQQVQQEVQKTQQEAQMAIQHQLSEAIKEQRKAMDQQLAQARADMEAYYSQKDQQRQLQAEKSVRQTVAHGTELLSQTQQWILHLTSSGFVKGVAWLPEAEVASLLAQIMAVQQTLADALESIRQGVSVIEEGSATRG